MMSLPIVIGDSQQLILNDVLVASAFETILNSTCIQCKTKIIRRIQLIDNCDYRVLRLHFKQQHQQQEQEQEEGKGNSTTSSAKLPCNAWSPISSTVEFQKNTIMVLDNNTYQISRIGIFFNSKKNCFFFLIASFFLLVAFGWNEKTIRKSELVFKSNTAFSVKFVEFEFVSIFFFLFSIFFCLLFFFVCHFCLYLCFYLFYLCLYFYLFVCDYSVICIFVFVVHECCCFFF